MSEGPEGFCPCMQELIDSLQVAIAHLQREQERYRLLGAQALRDDNRTKVTGKDGTVYYISEYGTMKRRRPPIHRTHNLSCHPSR